MPLDPLTPFGLIVYGLACFRLALLLSREDGPAWIFRKLRRAVPAESSAKQGIQCVLCSSVWFAIPIAIYAMHHAVLPWWLTAIGDWFVVMLAISSLAIATHMTFTKGI